MPRTGLSATTLLDGRAYFAGGSDGSADLRSTEFYEPETGRFAPAAAMSTARRGHLAIRIPDNNSVLLAGGQSSGEPSAAAELFVPWWNTYKPLPALEGGRIRPAAVALKRSGGMLMAGGTTSAGQTERT